MNTPLLTTIKKSTSEINSKDWNTVVANKNIYLSLDYLTALEQAMIDEIKFYYALTYNAQNQPILAAAFQQVCFTRKRKNGKIFKVNALVCGNIFSDGENGFVYNTEDSSIVFDEMNNIVNKIKNEFALTQKISVILFKEFFPETTPKSDLLKKYSYRDFMADVNMVLNINSNWKNINDYTQSLKAKYRTRFNSVFKKSEDLVIKPFNSEEINNYKKDINKLFKNVLNNSEFGYNSLKIEAFINFKKSLGDNFSMKGIFKENKLVGFSTSFFNKEILEANYVGIDYDYNQDYAIYQRLLYDYVEQAINNKAKELHLGRTSELIKSAIGAEPINMKLYIKHKSPTLNLLLKPFFKSISPSKFELRKPFKNEVN